MAKKENRFRGVFKRTHQGGVSYGIDYIHPMTGQRVRKILEGVISEAEALKLRGIELADAQRGAINKAYELRAKVETLSFEKMTDDFLEWAKENRKSWETDFHRAKALKRILKGKLASDLNPFMVEKYKVRRLKENVSRNTVNKELILGSQIFKKAAEWKKWTGENPFLGAERFEIKKPKKPGSLTPDQVVSIMQELRAGNTRDMVAFAFNTGWRIGEIRRLKWEDVDLEKGLAWIVEPKNANTVEIELNDAALRIIADQKDRGDFVFCHRDGTPFKTNINGGIKAAAERAGITLPPRKAWHILRRTWASMMLQNGCDVETLRELGNWKDISMPLWYADAAGRDHKRKVLNQMPQLPSRVPFECHSSAKKGQKTAKSSHFGG